LSQQLTYFVSFDVLCKAANGFAGVTCCVPIRRTWLDPVGATTSKNEKQIQPQ